MSNNDNTNLRLRVEAFLDDLIETFYKHYDKIINALLWGSPVQYRSGVLSEF